MTNAVQQLDVIRRFMQQPLMPVLGLLAAAGITKSGHGDWVAGGILIALLAYCGAAMTCILTRSLAGWVARMQRYAHPPQMAAEQAAAA